jgi:hypothetical protein
MEDVTTKYSDQYTCQIYLRSSSKVAGGTRLECDACLQQQMALFYDATVGYISCPRY